MKKKTVAVIMTAVMAMGVVAVEGTPQEVFSSSNVRIKEFLGKFHQGEE